MKELTDQDENAILDLFLGMYFFQFLASAVELDLFTVLSASPGLTREELAERLKLENQPARILLLGCGAVGLLRKEGDRYFNTSGAERFFSKANPANMVPAVRMANHIQYRPMARFTEALKTNTNVGLQEIPGSAPNLYMRLAETPRWRRDRSFSRDDEPRIVGDRGLPRGSGRPFASPHIVGCGRWRGHERHRPGGPLA